MAINLPIILYLKSADDQTLAQFIQPGRAQGDMCLFCRTEISFDTNMELKPVNREPATTAICQGGRFGKFDKAEQPAEKFTCRGFAGDRHGDLDMVDRQHPAHATLMSGASSAFMPMTLYPASTWWISPVTPADRSLTRYSPAPPTSSIVTLRRSGELYSFHFRI